VQQDATIQDMKRMFHFARELFGSKKFRRHPLWLQRERNWTGRIQRHPIPPWSSRTYPEKDYRGRPLRLVQCIILFCCEVWQRCGGYVESNKRSSDCSVGMTTCDFSLLHSVCSSSLNGRSVKLITYLHTEPRSRMLQSAMLSHVVVLN
jgi:hypothetical protein